MSYRCHSKEDIHIYMYICIVPWKGIALVLFICLKPMNLRQLKARIIMGKTLFCNEICEFQFGNSYHLFKSAKILNFFVIKPF